MAKSIGQCVDPEHPDKLYEDEGAWEALVWSKIDRTNPLGVDGWSNHPFGNKNMPLHMMIGLVRNDTKYTPEPPEDFSNHHNMGLEAECFDFDYADEDGPDPAGCRVFAKSFKPLQELRSCIVGHLDQDSTWSQRGSMTVTEGDFSGSYRDWCKQSVWTELPLAGGLVKFPAKLCARFDSKRRAQEMIKMVLFKPVSDDFEAAAKLVERKFCRSVTWPQGEQAPPCLQQDTMDAIRSQCFKVEEGKPLRQAQFLGKVSPCLPLMFDKVEIQGFGLNDGITKFQDEGYYGNDEQHLMQSYTPAVPAMCGRLALAAIPGFQRARYALTSVPTMVTDASALDTEPRWSDCSNPKETNCRKAYFCWEKALRRMCGLSPSCCPGDVKEALLAHTACREEPNVGDCPKLLATHSGDMQTISDVAGKIGGQLSDVAGKLPGLTRKFTRKLTDLAWN